MGRTTTTTMNEPTTALPKEIHSVFVFALTPVPQGLPRQSVKNVGEFVSIEEAFAVALEHARNEARLFARVFAPNDSPDTGEASITLLCTEWGYDVLHEHKKLTRLWIHSRPLIAA
jgi:hypothetical protein